MVAAVSGDGREDVAAAAAYVRRVLCREWRLAEGGRGFSGRLWR